MVYSVDMTEATATTNACKKIYVHINGSTGPTGEAHRTGGRARWADANFSKIVNNAFVDLGTIEVQGKDTRDCSAKIAKIAEEKWGVKVEKSFRKYNKKVEYVRGERLELHDYKEVYDFVGRKNILGRGYIEQC